MFYCKNSLPSHFHLFRMDSRSPIQFPTHPVDKKLLEPLQMRCPSPKLRQAVTARSTDKSTLRGANALNMPMGLESSKFSQIRLSSQPENSKLFKNIHIQLITVLKALKNTKCINWKIIIIL